MGWGIGAAGAAGAWNSYLLQSIQNGGLGRCIDPYQVAGAGLVGAYGGGIAGLAQKTGSIVASPGGVGFARAYGTTLGAATGSTAAALFGGLPQMFLQ
jgi:hypothetical protein